MRFLEKKRWRSVDADGGFVNFFKYGLWRQNKAAPGFYLQADGQVDPAAERRADGSRVKAEVFEELREGVRQRHPGPLLRHHDAGPNPGQIQTPSLDRRENLVIQRTEGLLYLPHYSI